MIVRHEKAHDNLLFLKDYSVKRERYLGGKGYKHSEETRSETIEDTL